LRIIIFPLDGKFEIKRDKKFGGDVSFDIYEGLEKAYSRGEVHPLDLKNAVVEGLERVVGPIRKGFR
jgi:tyrosyl-tRNA synthetase